MTNQKEYEALKEQDPWEDSSWIPSNAEILLPHDQITQLLLETPIAKVAIEDPVFIGPDDTMTQALLRMRQRQVRALLVTEHHRLVGIVTDRDAVKHINPGESGGNLRVREVMTSDPITVHMDEPVGKAAQLLCLDGVHHLPVVDDGGDHVVGIVALGRLLHAIIAEMLDQADREAS